MASAAAFEDVSENRDANFGSLITDKMIKEEHALMKLLATEEQMMQQKIASQDKNMAEEYCYKRLKLLLNRSSLYVKYMAEKIEKHEAAQNKKTEQRKRLEEKEQLSGKSKPEHSPVKKRQKVDVNIMDVYKKENMQELSKEEDENILIKQPTNAEDVAKLQPVLMTGGVMRSYQFDGFEWMNTLYESGVNCILADEMGLGKTIQCIAVIAHLIEMGISGPFFICGPLSTVSNWYAEFQRFTPDIPLVFYHGDKKERETLRKDINKAKKVGNHFCYPVVITSYAIALIDQGMLNKTTWKILVIDEAHRIKNFQCKLIEALKQYTAAYRLLLTGTPLQNNLTELWSLLNFIIPEIFDDLKVFRSWFDISRLTQNGITQEILAKEREKQLVSTIHQILSPFLLRRTKSDVKLDIPNKKEVIVECPLSKLQQKYYTSVLKGTIENDLGPKRSEELIIHHKRVPKSTHYFGIKKETGNILSPRHINEQNDADKSLSLSSNELELSDLHLNTRNITMCLRRICCHPYTISYPLDYCGQHLIDENIVRHSGKLRVLDILLSELKNRGHKVLIFSQFVSMLDVLQDYCEYRGHRYATLTGKLSLAERQVEIKQFNEDPSYFLFLISTRAGGLGINLVAADTVVIYDSDWNPQGDLQAQDRCHRIGQTKPVVVYRLLIRNTVDEKVQDYANAKRKLDKVIMQKGRFASNNSDAMQHKLTNEDLLKMLEMSEVKGFFKTDEDFVLSNEELEKLLDRSDLLQCD